MANVHQSIYPGRQGLKIEVQEKEGIEDKILVQQYDFDRSTASATK